MTLANEHLATLLITQMYASLAPMGYIVRHFFNKLKITEINNKD